MSSARGILPDLNISNVEQAFRPILRNHFYMEMQQATLQEAATASMFQLASGRIQPGGGLCSFT